jgi:DNA mismatch endonuclease, patch repair protein
MAEPTAARRRNMAAIRGKNTKPERLLRSAVFAAGLRFRLHSRALPGTPDLVFPRFQAAVFVHGCFWHRHEGCRFTTTPKNNAQFWAKKFAANIRRDALAHLQLRGQGWRVAVVWECAIRQSPGRSASELSRWLTSGDVEGEIAEV